MIPQIVETLELANMLNSQAAQLSAAEKDLDNARTRIEATQRSLLAIQDAIFCKLKEVVNETI